MTYTINPKIVFRNLMVFVLFLFIANLTALTIKLYFLNIELGDVGSFFDFNTERNLPTFYSSLALMLSGFLLYLIALGYKQHRKIYLRWLGLSLIFIFLSLDEMICIHEQIWMPTQKLLNTTGVLFYAWYIPYGIVFAAIFIFYYKFLITLPKNILFLFLTAGVIFVFGAVVLEAISGAHDEFNGRKNITYCLIYSFEELFEMIGVVIFIYALLSYISLKFNSLTFSINKP